jgi:hypothetical protein
MMVWISCPKHSQPVPTGIEVEPRCFAMLPEIVKGFTCSACGARHDLHRRDARLVRGDQVPSDIRRRRGTIVERVHAAA